MKALTLTEPWATLVMLEEKMVETRSWGTSYRGPLAIHAAKNLPGWAADVIREPGSPIRTTLIYWAEEWNAIPAEDIDDEQPNSRLFASTRGKVIATAELVSCRPTRDIVIGRDTDPNEGEFGDFSEGRYAWMLRRVQRVFPPIPARGALGLWDLDDALLPQFAVTP